MSKPVAASLVLLALIGLGTEAKAGLEPRHYVARRLAADHHLQVEIEKVSQTGETCRIEGVVVRAFPQRPTMLAPGAALAFSLPCSAQSVWPLARLEQARLVEVFLKTSPNGMEASDDGEGMKALAQPSDRPAITDDPALVREMTESMATYGIELEVKRGNPEGALALARVADPGLRLKLLAQAAGSMAARRTKAAEATAAEVLAAFDAMADDEARLEAGLAALEPLTTGGAREAALALANRLAPAVEALTLPSRRDQAWLTLYGARLRAEDPAAAFAALARVGAPKVRRERLEDMAFAQKDFGAMNPASPAWMERLLAAAESQTDPAFRKDALTALCRLAYRTAMGAAEIPDLAPKALAMAQPAAKRRHAPSAVLLALLTEAKGGAGALGEAARWHAVAGTGFDGGSTARADSLKVLAGFPPAARAEAARLLGGSGAADPKRLLELAAR